ncbi:class I SAM-dependent methyltransferase [Roseovarius phycicola]|uniref:Methyltransferase domain-containing protein n=1 Tax=Roseovarius phycicola TaxID=3080976 RepID=A0ABZ2HK54_9RHOB
MAKRLYGKTYHADRNARTRYAADTILKHVFGWHNISSVCDIGCGVGTWLAASKDLGATRVKGFDGPWVDKNAIAIEREEFQEFNLSKPLPKDEKFDLAMSLEVAEHLDPGRAVSLVADFCQLSDLVLFSAAIPGQGGTGHKNEQWQSYWADLFAQHGFQPVDIVRPLIWDDEDIAWWYRQNMLLYVKSQSDAEQSLLALNTARGDFIDLVHPEQLNFIQAAPFKHAVRQVLHRLNIR